jgi:two-component system chemotaxis response regulator CheY
LWKTISAAASCCKNYWRRYGQCLVAVNGKEAVSAHRLALDAGQPYDLICLDILMPEMGGHAALKEIRALEELKGIHSTQGAKIIMTPALGGIKNIAAAYHQLCDGYLVKPVDQVKLIGLLDELHVLTEDFRESRGSLHLQRRDQGRKKVARRKAPPFYFNSLRALLTRPSKAISC